MVAGFGGGEEIELKLLIAAVAATGLIAGPSLAQSQEAPASRVRCASSLSGSASDVDLDRPKGLLSARHDAAQGDRSPLGIYGGN
jgi:hypothetical protein